MHAASSNAELAAGVLPSTEAVHALAARLLGPELVIFPVRHHSPACAWQLRRWMAQARPSAVLVEGPRSFDALIPMLTHPQARMPLAVYTYAVLQPGQDAASVRHAAYYPFCDHSPELVALREAQSRGIPARFIDLDLAEQCGFKAEAVDEVHAQSLLDEHHLGRSRYLGALCARLGCRDHEELWEHLLEVPASTRTVQQHVAAMVAYCHLARTEYSDEDLRGDGTLPREAEMARHILQALAQRGPGDGPVLAVVGGFHAVALPALLDAGTAQRPPTPPGRVTDAASALIRYSQDRLDRLNGYSAGMTSPAWQQQLWERMLRQDKADLAVTARQRQELALAVLMDIALELRERHGLALPMPAVAAAYEQALRLAALRQRNAPVRDDVLDAVRSCFVKGEADADGALVLAVARRTLCGQAMGQVPLGASTPPLVRDFEYRARRQRLKIDTAEPRHTVLDIYRRPEHRATSRLFHGLTLLGVPLAVRTAGPDFVNGTGLERLQEHWDYACSAATEAALVEASVYGTTVPAAVAARFGQRLERLESGQETRDARAAAALLVQACVLGLHDHVPRLLGSLTAVTASDSDFDSVAAASATLALLWESREPLEARGIEELPALLRAAYERAVYLGHGLQGVVGNERAVATALSRLRELLVSAAGHALDATLFWALVEALRTGSASAFVRGASTGLAYSADRVSAQEMGVSVEGHLNGLLAPREAVAFLHGLLQTAREAAWQQPQLLAVLDGLLQSWSDTDFIANLPELRLAFAGMTPRETDRIAQSVAQLHGAADLGPLVHHDVSAQELQAHLALNQLLADVLQADGLDAWVKP